MDNRRSVRAVYAQAAALFFLYAVAAIGCGRDPRSAGGVSNPESPPGSEESGLPKVENDNLAKSELRKAAKVLDEAAEADLKSQLAAIAEQAPSYLTTTVADELVSQAASDTWSLIEARDRLRALAKKKSRNITEEMVESGEVTRNGELGFATDVFSIASFEPGTPDLHPADKARIVVALKAVEPLAAAAEKSNKIVIEALRRTRELPIEAQSAAKAAEIAQSIVANEPCFGVDAAATQKSANADTFRIAGVPVGVSNHDAFVTLCESTKGQVMATSSNMGDPAQSNGMSIDRTDADYWRDLAGVRVPVDLYETAAVEAAGAEHTGFAEYCIKCLASSNQPAMRSDIVRIKSLPDGRVYSIERERSFVKTISLPSPDGTAQKQVKPTTESLARLFNDFTKAIGQPNFSWVGGNQATIAWVLRSDGTPFGPNHWSRPGMSGKILLNGAETVDPLDSAYYFDKKALKASLSKYPLQATYCLFNSPERLRIDQAGVPFHPVIFWSESSGPVTSAPGESPTVPVPAAGLTRDCGKLLVAEFSFDLSGAYDEAHLPPPGVDPNVLSNPGGRTFAQLAAQNIPVYMVLTTVVDIDGFRTWATGKSADILARAEKHRKETASLNAPDGETEFVP